MFNPFRVFSLAADARRADRIFGARFPNCDTLAEKAEVAVGLLEGSRSDIVSLIAQLSATKGALQTANAKIERMTSGLRRGSKAKAIRLQDARAPHGAEA